MNVAPQEIIDYWYSLRLRAHWFNSTREIDREIAERYGAFWAAAEGGLDGWMATPEGCLALTTVLDQFPLNMYRGEKMFQFGGEGDSRCETCHRQWAGQAY